jgi:hypothetical protein
VHGGWAQLGDTEVSTEVAPQLFEVCREAFGPGPLLQTSDGLSSTGSSLLHGPLTATTPGRVRCPDVSQSSPPTAEALTPELAPVSPGVIYVHAIKKVVDYVHAMKKFLSTCMPRTRNSLTRMLFWMDSVST